MVKVPNRPPTPVTPRDLQGLPPDGERCPDLTVVLRAMGRFRPLGGEKVAVLLRQGRAVLLVRGQIVGELQEKADAQAITECLEHGGRYAGTVVEVVDERIVVHLEGLGR